MRQPKLSLYNVAFIVKTFINSFNYDNNFWYFSSHISQILLFNDIRSNFKPIFEVSSKFFIIEIDSLLYFKIVLNYM
jgi:hypothetical protein